MTTPVAGIRSALYEWVRGDASLTGAEGSSGPLGTADDPAYYPHRAPANAPFPHVVAKRSDQPGQRTLTATRGLRSATFDFEVWGDDTDVVESVVEALRRRLESARDHRGEVSIRAVELVGEVDDAEGPEDGSEVTWFVTVLTARFTYLVTSEGA